MQKKKEKESENGVIYARYSSHNQTEQSIEGQLRDAYDFAQREGIRIVGEYIDRAMTAKTDDRPDFQRMISDSAKKQFAIVIVWKLDRFARNRYDAAMYRAKLKRNGVRILSVKQSITDSPEGIILEGMLQSMAEYYSANLAQNVKRGLRETLNKGHYAGGHVPYGYKLVDGLLRQDELTAPVVRWIFESYANGVGRAEILRQAQARGIISPQGRQLTHTTYQSILKNTAYYGYVERTGIVIDCVPEPIITKELFDRVQAIIETHRRAPAAAKAKVEYALQGKVFCGMCGSSMVGESGRGRRGAVYHYYACSTKKRHHTCAKSNERKDELQTSVVLYTQRYILDPSRMDAISAAVMAQFNDEFGESRTGDLQRQITRLNHQLDNLVDSLADAPKVARQRIYDRIAQIEAQKADLDIDLAKLRLAQSAAITPPQIRAWLTRMGTGDASDPDYRRRIISVFVNSVYITDDRITIFYNLRNGQQVGFQEYEGTMEKCSDLGGQTLLSPPKSEPRYLVASGQVGFSLFR